MTTASDVSRLFRVHRTCREMLTDRGYTLRNYNADDEDASADTTATTAINTLEDFCAAYGSAPLREHLTLQGVRGRAGKRQDHVYVFFAADATVGVGPIRDYCARMDADGVRRAILVVQDSVTPFAKRELSKIAKQYAIEVFHDEELCFNVTRHVWVPPHTPLPRAQKAELLTRFKIVENQLERLLTTDPIARYYGLRRGQVVKIVRPSETSARYVTYRVVV